MAVMRVDPITTTAPLRERERREQLLERGRLIDPFEEPAALLDRSRKPPQSRRRGKPTIPKASGL